MVGRVKGLADSGPYSEKGKGIHFEGQNGITTGMGTLGSLFVDCFYDRYDLGHLR